MEVDMKVELRDLEGLLRKQLGEDLTVIEQITEKALALGENYGSTIFKVRAIVKRTKNAREEVLNLVAKMFPPTEFQRRIYDSTYTFKKEIFMYLKVMPVYRSLEREFDVPENEVFDILPKLYGTRYTLKRLDVVDEDAVILMQDLSAQGFYTADRREGLDLAHAKAALKALSRFHALGIAVNHHKPDLFKILRDGSANQSMNGVSFDDVADFQRDLLFHDPIMSKYRNLLEIAMSMEIINEAGTAPVSKPWCTIAHSDFWINNIMFRKDVETGDIKNIKFLDFQHILCTSPLRDLVLFVVTNLCDRVMRENFDELLEYYREQLVNWLKTMKCDTEPFSKEKFCDRIKLDALYEFSHCPYVLKVMTATVTDKSKIYNIKNLFTEEKEDLLFLHKMRRCVEKYVEKGWFLR